MESHQVVVVGSGFAGSILARILRSSGLEILLLDRSSHPRFALGESSTPLAALCLERLAERYELPDLAWLAAYGRWLEHLPELRRGLKRGFSFYRHRVGSELRPSIGNEGRLLVAASPADEVADSHWLRQDVDHFLVRRAVEEGVVFYDRAEIHKVRRVAAGDWRLSGMRAGMPFEVQARFVIDASGAGGFLQRNLPLDSAIAEVDLDTALVFGHFANLGPFPDLGSGPYPDQQAAVHHLLEEGWMYVLPFDHGVVSAGLILRREAAECLAEAGSHSAEETWRRVIGRYPTLEAQFGGATLVRPLETLPRVQRLVAQAAGEDWALLPHTFGFLDPMYSMGIAWSLLAVERLAGILLESLAGGRLDLPRAASGFARYGHLLASEFRQMERLLVGSYLALDDFALFTAQSFLYFATVSFEEVDQRLHPEGRKRTLPAWRGFLGADDERTRRLFAEARERLRAMPRDATGTTSSSDAAEFSRWIGECIAHHNVAGFGDPRRRNLYPVDLDLLVERSELLGMSADEMRAHLPQLRGVRTDRRD